MLDMRWFYEGKENFVSFSRLLNNMPISFYTSEFSEYLLDQFWAKTRTKILVQQFLPFIALMILAVFYMHYELEHEPDDRDDESRAGYYCRKGAGIFTILFIFWSLRTELFQFAYAERKMDYICSGWNWVDFFGLMFTLTIAFHTLLEMTLIPIESLRILAAVASLFLLMKVYDWLRLFENTAFYVLLLQETLNDLKWFLVLLGVAFLMFGLPMSMLSLNRSDEDSRLIQERFEFWFIDLIYNQYLLALGEFETDSFMAGNETRLVLLIFICATFYTQIIVLNMLIAVMSDSFANFMENRLKNAILTKLRILYDMAPVLSQQTKRR